MPRHKEPSALAPDAGVNFVETMIIEKGSGDCSPLRLMGRGNVLNAYFECCIKRYRARFCELFVSTLSYRPLSQQLAQRVDIGACWNTFKNYHARTAQFNDHASFVSCPGINVSGVGFGVSSFEFRGSSFRF